jgi:hypothetical protein
MCSASAPSPSSSFPFSLFELNYSARDTFFGGKGKHRLTSQLGSAECVMRGNVIV